MAEAWRQHYNEVRTHSANLKQLASEPETDCIQAGWIRVPRNPLVLSVCHAVSRGKLIREELKSRLPPPF
jgi:hypothetical protein